MPIRDPPQRAIDRLAGAYRDDPRYRALIIGGSVAKGYARDDSDVDFLIVATDDAFDEYQRTRDLFINRKDLCDYDGGFVDGKIIDLAFLADRPTYDVAAKEIKDKIEGCRPRPGFDAVMWPGQPETLRHSEQRASGITYTESEQETIRSLADRFGLLGQFSLD